MRPTSDFARASIEAAIKFLRRQLDDVEAQMATHVDRRTARTGSAEPACHLRAGRRGTLRQGFRLLSRTKTRGRFEVRRTLYMATLTATRYNPAIHAFYTRLIAAGKLPKVALIASMRKLVTILNAMVRSGRSFDLNHVHA